MSIIINDINPKTDQQDDYTFRDLSFQHTIDGVGSFDVKDFDSIRNSIYNIFNIRKGTRILDPTFGSNLDEFLFEQLNNTNANYLADEIEEILEQEPRITTDVIDVAIDKTNYQYVVTILFYIPTLTKDQLSVDVNINQSTGLTINAVKVNN